MKRAYIEKFIGQLDGMIGAIDQALALGLRTKKEQQAAELLRDARLKLIEDLETLPTLSRNIHEQVNDIVDSAMPTHKEASTYDVERAEWYVARAKDMYKDAGTWEVADIQSLIMTNPMPGCYSIQFWFVMLKDESKHAVKGAIFSETRD